MDPRTDIIETVTRLFWHVDHHDWTALTGVFADHVTLDYTALTGGAPAEVSPDEIVEMWRPGFEAIDAHQHLVTNHLVSVDGNEAVVTAAFLATHQHRDRSWTLGGDYRVRLARRGDAWEIVALTMTPSWQTGHPTLIADALDGATPTDPGANGVDIGDTFSLDR